MRTAIVLLLFGAIAGCAAIDATVGVVGSVAKTTVDVTGSVVSGTVDAVTSPVRDD